MCSAVTTMLVCYALGSPDRDGNLDPARFADGAASAAGWIEKVTGAMRTTRILREMSVETRELAVPSVLERASTASAEDDVLAAVVPEIDETTRGMPATSATLRMVHASALHQLLGLPPLQPWCLTREQQNGVLDALERHPEQVSRILRGDRGGTSGAVGEAVKVLWAGWSRDDVSTMLALSTTDRDIPRVLATAVLRPLPRPTARSRLLEQLRARPREDLPAHAADAVDAVFGAFVDCRVEAHSDFDRIRHPLSSAEIALRDASRETFPALLRRAAHQVGAGDLDLLSGLIALCIEPLPVAHPTFFAPTRWRFPA